MTANNETRCAVPGCGKLETYWRHDEKYAAARDGTPHGYHVFVPPAPDSERAVPMILNGAPLSAPYAVDPRAPVEPATERLVYVRNGEDEEILSVKPTRIDSGRLLDFLVEELENGMQVQFDAGLYFVGSASSPWFHDAALVEMQIRGWDVADADLPPFSVEPVTEPAAAKCCGLTPIQEVGVRGFIVRCRRCRRDVAKLSREESIATWNEQSERR